MRIFIPMPRALNIFTQMSGMKASPTDTTAAKIMMGRRSKRSRPIGRFRIRPPAKHPTGTVAMPQSMPRKSSL